MQDTCATNFMVRDDRMRALVSGDDEPITPFIDRIRELPCSTILVCGGAGSFFGVADRVIMMKAFLPVDATAAAKKIAAEFGDDKKFGAGSVAASAAAAAAVGEGKGASPGRHGGGKFWTQRLPIARSFSFPGKVKARDLVSVQLGDSAELDIRYLDQLVEVGLGWNGMDCSSRCLKSFGCWLLVVGCWLLQRDLTLIHYISPPFLSCLQVGQAKAIAALCSRLLTSGLCGFSGAASGMCVRELVESVEAGVVNAAGLVRLILCRNLSFFDSIFLSIYLSIILSFYLSICLYPCLKTR